MSEPKFLDGLTNMVGNRVQLASFPRSGNSFLRRILEQITGVFTGSDFTLRDALPLQHQGLLGEQTFGDNSIWVTKSHYPWMQMSHAPFAVEKVICIARNPIDVIPSFCSLSYLQSHTLEPDRPWSTFVYWTTLVPWINNQWVAYHNWVRE